MTALTNPQREVEDRSGATAAVDVAMAATERLMGSKPDAGDTAVAVDTAAKNRA